MITRLIAALVVLAALVVGYFWVALHWSFSSGERAGWVQKLSKKGWVCKTWEGELSLVSLPGSVAEKFFFTIHDDDVAKEIARHIGKRVALHYEEKVGLPTTCFGETRHFVTGVTLAEDIPLGPGVVVPAPGAAAPAMPTPTAVPAPATVPAPAAAPAPAALPTPTPAPAALPAAPALPASR